MKNIPAHKDTITGVKSIKTVAVLKNNVLSGIKSILNTINNVPEIIKSTEIRTICFIRKAVSFSAVTINYLIPVLGGRYNNSLLSYKDKSELINIYLPRISTSAICMAFVAAPLRN